MAVPTTPRPRAVAAVPLPPRAGVARRRALETIRIGLLDLVPVLPAVVDAGPSLSTERLLRRSLADALLATEMLLADADVPTLEG